MGVQRNTKRVTIRYGWDSENDDYVQHIKQPNHAPRVDSMSPPRRKSAGGSGKKVRVRFRQNRQKPPRKTDWTTQARDAKDNEFDADRSESVVAKGDISRQRTIIVSDKIASLPCGVVLAMRGLFAEVDDGTTIWPCTIRRVLRTRSIDERHPVAVGDRVRFRAEKPKEGVNSSGVIEAVEPRGGVLRRRSGKRIHTIVANVDQAVIVSSAGEPRPKPHLIDRYLVAAHAGGMTPIICMNKMDLDDGSAAELIAHYHDLGYQTLSTSASTGEGISELCDCLRGKSSVVAGQSGVGKSSLVNKVDPELRLRTANVSVQLQKGRHTTTTARLLRLSIGGHVVDTPGIRSFDLSTVNRGEYEAHFVEFAPHIPNCKYPNCTHTHEDNCAVQAAVESGEIRTARYQSYVHLFEDPAAPV